jgi:hypothetical protein
MRYIDAEALTDHMLERYNELCEECGDYDHYTTGYGDAIDVIENAPTADVVPKSEVEEIFKKLLNIIRNYSYDAMRCGNNYGITQAEYIGIDILELKKKYTGEKECPKCKHFVGCEQANWERGCDEYTEGVTDNE